MANLKQITLDTNWRYFPTEVMDEAFGTSALDESSWGTLAQLAAWPREVLSFYGELHLQHTFDLEPIGDVCVRYQLHLEATPAETSVFVNGWQVGTMQAGQSLTVDVTDYVTLEANLILMKVSKKGDIGAIWLQPVPCDGVG